MEVTVKSRTPTMQEILEYWYTDLPAETIAEKLNITVGKLYALRQLYGLPKRARVQKEGSAERDPSPEEIAAATQALQQSWSQKEEMSRRVGWKNRPAWTPPAFAYNARTGLFTNDEGNSQ